MLSKRATKLRHGYEAKSTYCGIGQSSILSCNLKHDSTQLDKFIRTRTMVAADVGECAFKCCLPNSWEASLGVADLASVELAALSYTHMSRV